MKAPRLFAIFRSYTSEVVYVSTKLSKLRNMLQSLPDGFGDVYQIVRYDAWADSDGLNVNSRAAYVKGLKK